MVHISILSFENELVLNCKKMTNGEEFQLIIDTNTLELIQKPDYPDMDASTAYSHVYNLLEKGLPLPSETVAVWG